MHGNPRREEECLEGESKERTCKERLEEEEKKRRGKDKREGWWDSEMEPCAVKFKTTFCGEDSWNSVVPAPPL